MRKKLPSIFKGIVKGNSQNQKQSIITNVQEEIYEDDVDVNGKIKDIFSSPNYVYKADVRILTTNGDEIKKTIIGKTNNSLITIDDELIDVREISQIDFLD